LHWALYRGILNRMQPSPGNPLPPPFPPPGGSMPGGPGTPPPMYYPPPMFFPQPPAPRGGFARAVFTTLAITLLGLSLTLNFYFLVYQLAATGAGDSVSTTVLEEGDAAHTIAVLPIT